MARRRKKRSSGRRRRSMGAMALNANSPVVQLGAVAVGYLFAGKPINDMLDKVTGGKVSGKIIAGAEVGLGALLLLKKGRKSLPQTIAGGVIAGAGLKRLLVEMGVVSGFQAVPVLGRLGGYQKVPVLGSPNGGLTVPRNGVFGYNTSDQKVMGGFENGNGNGNCINTDDL